MRYLFDNDIVIKLGQLHLLAQVCSALGATPSNSRHLSTLPFVARDKFRREKGNRRLLEQSLKRILDWCDQYPDLDHPCSPEILEQASRSPSVDPGEAILLAEAFGDQETVLITGDKRCLRALGTDPALGVIAQELRGRIQILESIILVLVGRVGFEITRKRIVAMPGIDQILDIAFGTGELDAEAHALEALRSTEAEIERLCPGLIILACTLPARQV